MDIENRVIRATLKCIHVFAGVQRGIVNAHPEVLLGTPEDFIERTISEIFESHYEVDERKEISVLFPEFQTEAVFRELVRFYA